MEQTKDTNSSETVTAGTGETSTVSQGGIAKQVSSPEAIDSVLPVAQKANITSGVGSSRPHEAMGFPQRFCYNQGMPQPPCQCWSAGNFYQYEQTRKNWFNELRKHKIVTLLFASVTFCQVLLIFILPLLILIVLLGEADKYTISIVMGLTKQAAMSTLVFLWLVVLVFTIIFYRVGRWVGEREGIKENYH